MSVTQVGLCPSALPWGPEGGDPAVKEEKRLQGSLPQGGWVGSRGPSPPMGG